MKKRETPITMESARSFAAAAQAAFSFLEKKGFRMLECRGPASTDWRDGFRLRYRSGDVELIVEYFDMDLGVTFVRGTTRAGYLLIDHELFGNASGLAGIMFPLGKLAGALETISEDVRSNYGQILAGDEAIWNKLERLVNAPVKKAPRSRKGLGDR